MPRRTLISIGLLIAAVLISGILYFRRPAAVKAAPVTIGAILPLSGDGAEFGKDGLVGAQIAIDEINRSSPDKRVALMVEDSRTQPKDGIAAYQRLSAINQRPAAFISTMSSVCSALVPLVERDRVPLFCIAAAPSLTQGNKFVFRALPTASYQAQTLLALSARRLGYRKLAALFVNDEFGSSMEQALRSEASREGLVFSSEGVQASTSDFRAAFSRLLSTAPDAIFVAAFGTSLGSAMKQLKELGFKGIVLAPLEIGYPKVLEVAGASAEGVIFADTSFDADSKAGETAGFVEEFARRAGRKPSLDAVLAYDEIMLLYRAASVKGSSPESIRQSLLSVKGYKSINGNAVMLPNGDLAYELRLKKIERGKPRAF